MLLALLIVAAESAVPYVMAAMGRYTVDEVLELDPAQAKGRMHETAKEKDDSEAAGASAAEADAKQGKSKSEKHRLLTLIFVATIAVYFLHSASKVLHKYMLGWVGEKVVLRLRAALHEKLQQLQMTFHDQHEKGRLMARVMDDVVIIRRTSVHLSTSLTVNTFMVLVGATVLLLIDVKLALVSFMGLPLFGFIYAKLRIRMRDLWRSVARQRAGMYGLVGDRLASPETIKSFGQEQRESIRLFRRARDLLKTELKLVVFTGFLILWVTLLHGVFIATALGMGALAVKQGTLSIGYLLFFYGSFGLMFMPVQALCMLVPYLQRFRVSAERVMEILDEPVTIYDKPGAVDLPLVGGLIRFRDVSLQYDGSEKPALKNITLDIQPGERVCLMGPSGSGKTTLVNLLLRLYEPTGGTIRLDGQDLGMIKMASLKEHVGYVPQDAFLFSCSLRDNIRYGNLLAGEDDIARAAKAAELHEFVMTLPQGYDTIVGERGVTLSGGQRQRVSLARALLTDPRVLILDDCTSALDAITEAKIVKTLRTALAGRTTIIITHRVSMSSRADWVVVLKDGEIVEVGSHEELLTKEGVYYDLVIEQLAEKKLGADSANVERR